MTSAATGGSAAVGGGVNKRQPPLPYPFLHSSPLTNSAMAKSPTLAEKSNLPNHLSNLIRLREEIASQERKQKETKQEQIKRLIEMQKDAADQEKNT